MCFTNTTKQRFTHSAFCIWKPSRFKSSCLLWQGWFSINSIFLSIFMSFSQSSKQFLSVYIDSIICSVPFYSFTQLFASRIYAAKITTHINYFVNLPILRPSQRLHTIYITYSSKPVSYNDHMLNYLLKLFSTFYSHNCLSLLAGRTPK